MKSCEVFWFSLFVGGADDVGDVDDGVGDVDDGVGDLLAEDFAFFLGVATGVTGLTSRGSGKENRLKLAWADVNAFRYKLHCGAFRIVFWTLVLELGPAADLPLSWQIILHNGKTHVMGLGGPCTMGLWFLR